MAGLRTFDVMLLQHQVDGESMQYLNFGLVMVEKGWPASGEAHVQLATERQWEMLESVGAGVEELRALGEALKGDLVHGTATKEGDVKVGELFRKYRDQFSITAQLSELRKPVVGTSAAQELESLTHLYLERPKWIADRWERAKGSRTQVVERLRDEFRVWGVLEHPGMRKGFLASDWAEGLKQKVRIDFGYATRDGREFKLYQAVDASRDVEALRLAHVWPKLREGIRVKAQREARLTAVVGEGRDEAAIEVMEEAGMRIAMVGEAENIARVAAEELL